MFAGTAAMNLSILLHSQDWQSFNFLFPSFTSGVLQTLPIDFKEPGSISGHSAAYGLIFSGGSEGCMCGECRRKGHTQIVLWC